MTDTEHPTKVSAGGASSLAGPEADTPERASGALSSAPAGEGDPVAAPGRLHIKGYRPEIDGLRALAVLPVLFFHAGLGFPGGYVGVDIFFVISGYLITSLIFKEMEAGTFSLANFWARRARRIVPASLLLTLAVLAAGWFLLLPTDFMGLGKATAAQASFSSNLYFWSTANYFAGDVDTLPLLHTWSLAVEEQFYIFFPLLLLVFHRLPWLRRRGVLLGLLATGFVASLALSAYTMPKMPIATFYLLPTRAWELLAGSLLALFPASWTPARRGPRELLSGVGLLLIGLTLFCYDKATIFPGLAALPPCLGAGLIIWSNNAAAAANPGLTLVGRVLASPAPVFVGLISYSLYLWHWPLLAFSIYSARGPLTLGGRWMLVGLSLALAAASWAFVEGPFRKRQVFASRNSVLGFAAGGLATLLILGLAISRGQGFAGRFPARVNDLANAREDRVPHPEIDTRDIVADRLMPLGADQPGVTPQLLLWGDSHAAAAVPALDLYCRRHGINGRAAVHSSTSPLLNYYTRSAYGLNERTVPYSQAVFDYVGKNHIPRVFLACYWERDLLHDPEQLETALVGTIKAFRATETTLYVLLQVPSQRVNVPRALALDALHPRERDDWRSLVQAHQDQQAVLYRLAAKYASPKCVFIDPAPTFEDRDGRLFEVVRDGHPLYIDETHMSVFASRTFVEPLLERVLDGH